MDRFGPTGKVSKTRVHLLRWTTFPGRTGWNFGWMDRALCLRALVFKQERVHQKNWRRQKVNGLMELCHSLFCSWCQLHVLIRHATWETACEWQNHSFVSKYVSQAASYPDVSLSTKMCTQRKTGRRAVCILPMVPYCSLPVARLYLAKTKRLRGRLSSKRYISPYKLHKGTLRNS